MRFLCAQCNSRYAIDDERVAGKVLSVRCKTCSNVITVAEGMSAPEPAPKEQVVTGVEETATFEELEADIQRLRSELRRLKDLIADLTRTVPEAKRDDARRHRESERLGFPPFMPIHSWENGLQKQIDEARAEREDVEARIASIKTKQRELQRAARDRKQARPKVALSGSNELVDVTVTAGKLRQISLGALDDLEKGQMLRVEPIVELRLGDRVLARGELVTVGGVLKFRVLSRGW